MVVARMILLFLNDLNQNCNSRLCWKVICSKQERLYINKWKHHSWNKIHSLKWISHKIKIPSDFIFEHTAHCVTIAAAAAVHYCHISMRVPIFKPLLWYSSPLCQYNVYKTFMLNICVGCIRHVNHTHTQAEKHTLVGIGRYNNWRPWKTILF